MQENNEIVSKIINLLLKEIQALKQSYRNLLNQTKRDNNLSTSEQNKLLEIQKHIKKLYSQIQCLKMLYKKKSNIEILYNDNNDNNEEGSLYGEDLYEKLKNPTNEFSNNLSNEKVVTSFRSKRKKKSKPKSSKSFKNKRLKIVILGDSKSGKTTFINRLKTGNFNSSYHPTLGADTSLLNFSTNRGKINTKIWDLGSGKYKGLEKDYWQDADGFLIFFDITDAKAVKTAYNNIEKIKKFFKDQKVPPIAICGNKYDKIQRKILNKKAIDVEFPISKYYKFFKLSAKSNYNFEKPFIYLFEKLLNKSVKMV